MLTSSHRSHDESECLESELFLAEEWMGSEEGNHLLDQIRAVPNYVDERLVSALLARVPSDVTTSEVLTQQIQDRCSFRVLTYLELRNEMPPILRRRIALDRDVEGSFPINVSR